MAQLLPKHTTIDGRPAEVVVIDGVEIEVGDAWECGRICGCKPETFAQYSSKRLPKGNPPPRHIARSHPEGRALYPLEAVRQWQASRRGKGGWGHK